MPPPPLDKFEGKRYELLRVSAPDLDGMALELWEAVPGNVTTGSGDMLIRAEYVDATGEMTVTTYQKGLTDSLVAWFTGHAWDALPPVDPAA